MSEVVLVICLVPIIVIICSILYVINKIYPGGIIKAFSESEHIKIVLTSEHNSVKNSSYYKINLGSSGLTTFILPAADELLNLGKTDGPESRLKPSKLVHEKRRGDIKMSNYSKLYIS